MTVKWTAYGEDYVGGFFSGTCSDLLQGKPRRVLASDQTKLSISTTINASNVLLKVATNWLPTESGYYVIF